MNKTKCSCGCTKPKLKERKESVTGKQAIKKASEAVDAFYTLYELAKKDKGHFDNTVLDRLDEAFESSNKVLSELLIRYM